MRQNQKGFALKEKKIQGEIIKIEIQLSGIHLYYIIISQEQTNGWK